MIEAWVEQYIGIPFKDRGRTREVMESLAEAGSHGRDTYERLEFLGDRVLGLVVAEMLYRTFNKEDEGAMAKRLAALVRQEGLAHVARSIDLGSHLILSRGEAEGGGRDNAATLADACEAVIGAIYLDGGLDRAEAFVKAHWGPFLDGQRKAPVHPKSALQEVAAVEQDIDGGEAVVGHGFNRQSETHSRPRASAPSRPRNSRAAHRARDRAP